MNLPSLNALRSFAVVAKCGSFTSAAEELYLTQGAVSHQIRTLETQLGFPLFHREARHIRLTQQGAELLPLVRHWLEELRGKIADLQDTNDDNGQTISVLTTTYFASRWLLPRLHEFMESAPGITVRLLHGALEDRRAPAHDIEIKWGGMSDRLADETSLFEAPLTPVCAPSILQRFAPAELLAGVTFLHDDAARSVWRHWLREAGHSNVGGRKGTIISDPNVRMQATVEGHGFALADPLVNVELLLGHLTRPFAFCLDGYGYRALCVKRSEQAEAFLAFLAAQSRNYLPDFAAPAT